MERQGRFYPIGIQTFEKIRVGNYMYIDKTEYVYRMVHSASNYIFLSRPRRFGKSLLTSTLEAYFEGRRELFRGLALERLETEWTEYPVLRFDMSTAKHVDKERLESELNLKLIEYENVYGRGEGEENANQRFQGIIRRAYEQTGRQVVVLIDEYDAPLLDVVHEEKNLPILRNIMRNFYSPLKACDPYLRFVFLTGITKFSQLSIFSELNNIKNISMLPDNYDGYHFTWPSPDIYNPFSLLNAFADGRLDSYWFGSGTPTYLIEMLKKYGVQPQQIGGRKAMAESFDAPTERMTDIAPLLYQSGYVTIKGYSPVTQLYTLDIPNKEVRLGLMKSLLPGYLDRRTTDGLTTVALLYEAIYEERLDDALRLLQTFLSTVPYCDRTDYEGHYQQMLYIIFSLLGMYVDVEVRTPSGRVDMVMRTATTLYVVELKLNQSAEAAMQQIDLKNYPERFALCGLPVVKVGIDFDMERHTLKDWVITR